MKKLSKDDKAKRDEFAQRLDTLAGEIEDWKNDLHQKMEDFYEEKSDKWKEGDAGDAYTTWKDAVEAIDADELRTFKENLEGIGDEPG